MTDLLTVWWVWIGLGLALAALEVLLPGFIFLGIAIGAAVLGVLQLVLPAIFADMSDTALMAVFGGLSLLAWIGLRLGFKSQTTESKTFVDDVND
ncbi:MAG: hypothetical protein AAF412_10840 [Pseudomonadota bacterium]